MKRKTALSLALAAAVPASAVTLNPDGLGQALIYPYYTTRSAGNDAYNTYISVVNHTSDAKALRLRFREGRLGKSVLDMNLYLSPNDVWTGAVVPFSTGARLISADNSCTEPRFAVTVAPGEAPFIDFRNDAFSGANDDGAGTGLDRTREGFVEILEMATLTGASATAVTHNAAGIPRNCAAILGGTPLTAPPSGGLSGTLTLINVASGVDFNLNAEALDSLAQRAYYRAPSDPYPDFNAAEIDPVSVVEANGATYRSTWSRPADAVSAVLMRPRAMMEYVLDQATASLTEVVLTMPTRHFYPSGTAPFTRPPSWTPGCTVAGSPAGEPLTISFLNRDEQGGSTNPVCSLTPCPPQPPAPVVCGSAGVMTVRNLSLTQFVGLTTSITPVFGSLTQGLNGGGSGILNVISSSAFQSGWLDIRTAAVDNRMTSGAASTMLRHATGEMITGPHTFKGLPMTGFSARIFRNGSLRCDVGTCQGNYGGAFPIKSRREISP